MQTNKKLLIDFFNHYSPLNFSLLLKVLLKCTVESHHEAPVTSIQWTNDGTKLFTADSGGNVAITVINMDEVCIMVYIRQNFGGQKFWQIFGSFVRLNFVR